MFYKILLFIAFSGVFSNRSIIQIISSQESTSKIPPLQQKNKLPTIYSDDYIYYKDFTFELFACVQNDSYYEKHSKNTYRLHNVAIKKIVPEYSCHHIYAEVEYDLYYDNGDILPAKLFLIGQMFNQNSNDKECGMCFEHN